MQLPTPCLLLLPGVWGPFCIRPPGQPAAWHAQCPALPSVGPQGVSNGLYKVQSWASLPLELWVMGLCKTAACTGKYASMGQSVVFEEGGTSDATGGNLWFLAATPDGEHRECHVLPSPWPQLSAAYCLLPAARCAACRSALHYARAMRCHAQGTPRRTKNGCELRAATAPAFTLLSWMVTPANHRSQHFACLQTPTWLSHPPGEEHGRRGP